MQTDTFYTQLGFVLDKPGYGQTQIKPLIANKKVREEIVFYQGRQLSLCGSGVSLHIGVPCESSERLYGHRPNGHQQNSPQGAIGVNDRCALINVGDPPNLGLIRPYPRK